MAGYDTSIRVNTKVDNSDLKKVQKDFDEIEKKSKKVSKVSVAMSNDEKKSV